MRGDMGMSFLTFDDSADSLDMIAGGAATVVSAALAIAKLRLP